MKRSILNLAFLSILMTSCHQHTSILEVTTFQLNDLANPTRFHQLDAQIEATFTSKQPGFIHRQSGLTEQGEYVVLVYWNSAEEADASMKKFMSDPAVAEYASMIKAESMDMSRYTTNKAFDANSSRFIELMRFQLKDDVTAKTFQDANTAVEKGFTANQKGFLQRISGSNEQEDRMVVIYWDTKAHSDAALQPFMRHELSNTFLGLMNDDSVDFKRYQSIESITKQQK